VNGIAQGLHMVDAVCTMLIVERDAGHYLVMEYQANARIIREKTERLKALRLAKEAADKERAG